MLGLRGGSVWCHRAFLVMEEGTKMSETVMETCEWAFWNSFIPRV